jgi:hypothetical protein
VSSTPGDRLRGALRLRTTPRRLTAASALVIVAGLIAGVAGIAAASGAGGNHAVRVDLADACRFPAATYQVSAQLAATFPASAATGTPIQPAGLQVTVILPPQAAAYLRGLGASTVTASGSLAVTATSRGVPVPATWPIRTSSAAGLPATGRLTLETSGTAPPAAASASGPISFAATGLALTLTLRSRNGAATTSATVPASCAASNGHSMRLATVDVTAPSAPASVSASGSPRLSPKPAIRNRSRFPKGCGHIKVIGTGEAVCGYMTG